ncbi:MAG TPA: AmmeMemoRadiSam system protein B [Nitrososphaeraceae archaeon]|nr:AmmeMemoRadiSam system protein B [Nitrososphaeraceae archaeon]
MNSFVREPAVSGIFYPKSRNELNANLESLFKDSNFGPGKLPPSSNNERIYGMVCPHAGYMYSGHVAANGYYQLSSSKFDCAIIVGPNHYGLGSDVALMNTGSWKTPLGEIEIDTELSQDIHQNCELVSYDELAHSRDHCIEVQLPFLQYIRQEFKIVPIILINQGKNMCLKLGDGICESIKKRNLITIASSDLTHYEPNTQAHEKDNLLISAILSLDIQKFYSILLSFNVTACGYGAIATVMEISKRMGAKRGKLLKYATSGDVAGDNRSVVGYSSILFV